MAFFFFSSLLFSSIFFDSGNVVPMTKQRTRGGEKRRRRKKLSMKILFSQSVTSTNRRTTAKGKNCDERREGELFYYLPRRLLLFSIHRCTDSLFCFFVSNMCLQRRRRRRGGGRGRRATHDLILLKGSSRSRVEQRLEMSHIPMELIHQVPFFFFTERNSHRAKSQLFFLFVHICFKPNNICTNDR